MPNAIASPDIDVEHTHSPSDQHTAAGHCFGRCLGRRG